MGRRIWLCAFLLILALPMLAARRRTVTPGDPDRCVYATLSSTFIGAELLAVDDEYLYIVDTFSLVRVPKFGNGDFELLVFDLGDWLPTSMTVDETTVYIGAMPFDAIFTKAKGSILAVPKTGGEPVVLANEVKTPFAIATDATHVYWTALGTVDYLAQRAESDGSVERIEKGGANRQVIAADLSTPFTLALDATHVYYSETGIADDDPTTGLFRVAKSGGDALELGPHLGAISLSVDGDTVVLIGGNDTEGGLIAIDKSGATPMRILYSGEADVDESVSASLRVADRRVYYVRSIDGGDGELVWVDIDSPNGVTVVRKDLYFEDDFVLDGCAAIVSTLSGQLLRAAR